MSTSGSTISVQPHISIMHAVISDTQGQIVGARAGLNGQKKMARRITFLCAIFTACLDFPLPPLSAPESPRIYGNLI